MKLKAVNTMLHLRKHATYI